jgi:ribonuclease BN (tRNA processing enzyme)
MDVRILGAHNCESQKSRFVSLLIDEVLAIDAGNLTSSLPLEAQLKLKAVLLTHHHYDHIRDIPALGMNCYLGQTSINVYAPQPVYDALSTHLMNGELYPKFLEKPENKPTIRFNVIEPGKSEQIAGYDILALLVSHSIPAVGYQVTSPDGKSLFYTGDTGPGLTDCWKQISPQLLIVEVTASDRFQEAMGTGRHLTPTLLKQELTAFRELKGYLPRVIAVHMSPSIEAEIKTEVATLAAVLDSQITLAHEGMLIHL